MEDKRGWRAMECGGGGVSVSSDDKGRDNGGKVKEGGEGCSKCNGDSSGDGDGCEDDDSSNHSCVEGNGVGNAVMAAAASTKAAKMMEAMAMVAAWLQGQQQQQHNNNQQLT